MRVKNLRLMTIAAGAAAVLSVSCGGPQTSSNKPLTEKQAQKQAEKQAKADAKASEELKVAYQKVNELDEIRIRLMGLSIPCGVGIGQGESESEAQRAALDSARSALEKSVDVQIFRLGDTHAMAVGKKAKDKWSDNAKSMTAGHVRTTAPYKSVTVRDKETKTYTVHTLLILDPVKFKAALTGASIGNDEFKSKAQEDMIMMKMDAIIADFNSKYRRK